MVGSRWSAALLTLTLVIAGTPIAADSPAGDAIAPIALCAGRRASLSRRPARRGRLGLYRVARQGWSLERAYDEARDAGMRWWYFPVKDKMKTVVSTLIPALAAVQ
jgi:hypothetical protein